MKKYLFTGLNILLNINYSLPKIGRPSLKMSESYFGASLSYTEFGPPEMIMALKP